MSDGGLLGCIKSIDPGQMMFVLCMLCLSLVPIPGLSPFPSLGFLGVCVVVMFTPCMSDAE